MTFAPEALPDHAWEEQYVISSVRDLYRHPKHGRVLEFIDQHKQYRIAPITRVRILGKTAPTLD